MDIYKGYAFLLLCEARVAVTTIPDTAHALMIGHQSSSSSPAGSYQWGGAIDEVRVYNRVLSPSEVASLYSNP